MTPPPPFPTRQQRAEAIPWRTADSKPIRPLTRQQILMDIRSNLEEMHRDRMLNRTTRFPYRPILSVERPMLPVSLFNAQDCCNKSTAVYKLCHFPFPDDHLHNFLFHSWNQPYTNAIAHDEFIAKVIIPILPEEAKPVDPIDELLPLPRSSPPAELVPTLLEKTAELHRALVDEVLRTLSRAEEYIDNWDDHNFDLDYIDMPSADKDKSQLQFYRLRPLFRELVIVIAEYDIDQHRHHYKDDFGKQPVYLLRTGYTDRLGAPIDFSSLYASGHLLEPHAGPHAMSVKTTLSAAVGFVQSLEEREKEAFSPQPSPLQSEITKEWLHYDFHARELGWTGPGTTGPSSTWIDASLVPSWVGYSARFDLFRTYEEASFWMRWDRFVRLREKTRKEMQEKRKVH